MFAEKTEYANNGGHGGIHTKRAISTPWIKNFINTECHPIIFMYGTEVDIYIILGMSEI